MTETEKAKTLGATINQARRRAGLSLRGLAPQIPVHFVYLSEIENDKIVPSETVLRSLANVKELELDFDVLMALAGKFGEETLSYLKEQPKFGRIVRNIAEAKPTETELIELDSTLKNKFKSTK